MNNIFDFKRFGHYFIYDVRRWISSYGPTFLLMALAPLILYAVVLCYSLVFGYGWNAPGFSARVSVLVIITFVMLMTYPASVYGYITDKKAGSAFLMMPVSLTEKFISMILNVLVIVPLAFALIYFSCDAVLCLVDKGCGSTLISSAKDAFSFVLSAPFTSDSPIRISMFAIYITFAINILYFLLGAIFFRKHKILYPILILVALQMCFMLLLGFLSTAGILTNNVFESFMSRYDFAPERLALLARAFNVVSSVWNCIVTVALLLAIYFRLKTIKH